MVPANVNDYFVIRFCVCAQNATSEDIGTDDNNLNQIEIRNQPAGSSHLTSFVPQMMLLWAIITPSY